MFRYNKSRNEIRVMFSPYGIATDAVIKAIQKALDKKVIPIVPRKIDDKMLLINMGADLVFFDGGADVTPGLYNENKHPTTSNNVMRDLVETKIYDAYAFRVPLCGLCRGHQFLSVMNGHKLIQHLEDTNQNHNYMHDVVISEDSSLYGFTQKEKIRTNSTHHQAVKYVNGIGNPIAFEPITQVVEAMDYVHQARSVQWHPESLDLCGDNISVLKWLFWSDVFCK